MPSKLLATAFAAIAVIATACGGTAASPAASRPASTQAAASSAPAASGGGGADGAAVTIVDNAFEPAELSVAVGSTVTWTNTGSNPHTVKWADGTAESDRLSTDGTTERTFDTAGSFPYMCGIHSSMTGTITVTE